MSSISSRGIFIGAASLLNFLLTFETLNFLTFNDVTFFRWRTLSWLSSGRTKVKVLETEKN